MLPSLCSTASRGVYTVKMGRELTIAPTVEYAEGATYSWIVDGKLAGSEPTYTAVFTELGEVYITFRVETAAGKAEAELRVDVLELTPPVISLALPTEGLKVLPGVEYTFTPDIQHSDQEDFRCRWLCAGEVVSTQMSYTFREEAVGELPDPYRGIERRWNFRQRICRGGRGEDAFGGPLRKALSLL